MKTIPTISIALLLIVFGTNTANASILPYDKVTIGLVTTTTAKVSYNPTSFEKMSSTPNTTPPNISSTIGYFEYYPTNQVCIAIYPTPKNCLPKKTAVGITSATLTGLTPNTSYTVIYKIDNTIRCITTPCPDNTYRSQPTVFVTKTTTSNSLSRNLYFGARGDDVTLLQDVLRTRGYFTLMSTGYFGSATLKAVKDFQQNVMHISPIGYVGPLTRTALMNTSTPSDVRFEGIIQAVSTACFADGECSITIDGKKVITTIGRSRNVVGSIRGTVSDIRSIETSKIGARAKVYAQQTLDGYSLYGNANYSIEVL